MLSRPMLTCALAASALSLASVAVAQPALERPVLKKSSPGKWPKAFEGHEQPARSILVKVTLDKAGNVVAAHAREDVDPQLAEAAENAAKGWTFRPARRAGKPIAAKILLKVAFPPIQPTFVAPGVTSPPGSAPRSRAPAKPPGGASEAPPEHVVVEGERLAGQRRESASEYRIRPQQFAVLPKRSAEQLLTLAPGVYLANPSGEGHASAIFLRGFDAKEGQDVAFSVAGMPINDASNIHGHGYADTYFIIPEVVQRMTVIEGPFDASQGDFAVAASVRYQLGLAQRGAVVQGSAGSFGRRRLLGMWGPKGANEGTFVAFDLQQGNGFGPNRAFSNGRLLGQREIWLSPELRLRLTGGSYGGRFGTAGILREDDLAARALPCAKDFASQFYCSYFSGQGGYSARHFGVIELLEGQRSFETAHRIFVSNRYLRIRENYTGFVTDISAPDGVQRGDGIEQTTSTWTLGLSGHSRWKLSNGKRKSRVEFGYFGRMDLGDVLQARLRHLSNIGYTTETDVSFRTVNIGAYAKGLWQPFNWLLLRPGFRADSYSFATETRGFGTSDRRGARIDSGRAEAYGVIFQPKLSVEVPVLKSMSVMASYGIGSRSSSAFALSDGEFAPFAEVKAYEVGVVHSVRSRGYAIRNKAVAYRTDVARDLVFDEIAGRNIFAGESRRFGAVLSSQLQSRQGLSASASFTFSEAYLPESGAGFLDLTSGRRLPYIPRTVLRSDVVYHRKLGRGFRTEGGLGLSFLGPRPLPQQAESPSVGTLDASVHLAYRSVLFGLSAMNLTDRRNRQNVYNYVSNFRGGAEPASQLSQRHFVAGPPRTFLATLQIHWEPKVAKEKAGS